ncbi:MAG: hypothetical protein QM703_05310 [Gemmatales bacterium]
MPTNLPTISKTNAWKRLRFLQRWNGFLYIGLIPGVLLLSILLGFITNQGISLDTGLFIAGIPWAIAIIISNTLLFACPCPECLQPFFVKKMTFWHGFFFARRNCIHCGASKPA